MPSGVLRIGNLLVDGLGMSNSSPSSDVPGVVPPPVVETHTLSAEDSPASFRFPEIEKHENEAGDGQPPRAIATSVVVHTLVLGVLFIIAAPTHVGQHLHGFVLRLDSTEADDWVPVTQVAPLDGDLSETTEPFESENAQTLSDSLDRFFETARTAMVDSDDAINQGAKKGTGEAIASGAPGSFFGLESVGNRIVYVVDRSTSMRGQRFEMAKAELLSSIGGLRPDQEFAVIFFARSELPIVGPSGKLEWTTNDAKNMRWLVPAIESAGLDNWTDPREAVQSALKMNPESVFVLSDGEFNGLSKRDAFQGRTVFDLLDSAAVKPRVQAVALHNVESLSNMKRLAEQSGGSYRFIPNPEEVEAQAGIRETLAKAEAAGVRPEPLLAAKVQNARDAKERDLYFEVLENHLDEEWKSLSKSADVEELTGAMARISKWPIPKPLKVANRTRYATRLHAILIAGSDDAALVEHARWLYGPPPNDLDREEFIKMQYSGLQWLETRSRAGDSFAETAGEWIQKLEDGEPRFQLVLKRIRREQRDASRMLDTSEELLDSGKTARAQRLLESLIERYPLSSSSPTARQWLVTRF